MTSFKRIGALILMLALIVPILAACGGGGTAESPTSAAGGAATSAPAATAATGGEAATAMPEATAMPAATAATGGEAATAMPAATAATSGMAGEGATAGASGDLTKIQVEDGATLRIIVNGNPTEQKLYQDGVARFNQVFPNVKVTVDVNNDSYETNMKAQMAAGTAPDVFLLPPQLMGAFAPEGLLLPLDDAMSQAGVQAGDYVESIFKLFQQDGKQYGIPKDFGTLALFFNNDIASAAGVDPASVKTWTQLQEAAQKMTSGEGPNKVYGMCLNPDIQRIGTAMLQNGNPIIQDGKAVFNQENGIAAINFWYSFKEAGTGELFKEMGKGWCGEAFSSKAAGIVMEGGWLVPFMADAANNATDVKYTAIPLPTPDSGGKPADWLFTNAFGANAKTQYPNAAAALVLYLTSAQNQKALLPSGLATPSLLALADDPYFAENPTAKVLVDQGKIGTSVDLLLGGPTKVGDVVSKMNQGIEAIFLGQATTQDALDQAAQDADGVLSQ
jgi:multiple sugar transport system substrate-binding protein